MKVADSLSLVQRQSDQPICLVSRPHTALSETRGYVPTATFLRHVEILAALLPEGRHAINLCGNRYLFMLAMCAVIVKRQTNLFPPNRTCATQCGLIERYPETYVIHDGTEVADHLSAINLQSLPHGTLSKQGSARPAPEIALDHLAAISFTSGSTGQSKPNNKTWNCLTQGAYINRQYMLRDDLENAQMVTTVPGQHMWGLEASVMQAMTSNICISDASPLYPKDIQSLLVKMQAPRILVSAPVHLRAMVLSGLSFPPVERILCATAPLDFDIARKVERCFGGELVEIYGCSEVGSMAWRKTATEKSWSLFNEIKMDQQNITTIASAEHIPEAVEMQDIIQFSSDGRFQLSGRQTDMVEIGGKRGSLKEFNQMLLKIEGLKDGAVFLPEQNKAVPRLVAFVVMQEGVGKSVVADKFRQHFDNAFVPRPIVQLAAMPREENGKLPRGNLEALYHKLVKNTGKD